MDFKNFMKGIGNYFFAEALCLFLALTLSAIGGAIARIVSCICTIGVLVCLCINFAVNRGKSDKKANIPDGNSRRLLHSLAASVIFLLLGICLLLAKGGILPAQFYRWYKLLDAPFLQLCNLFCKDITAASLSWSSAVILAATNLLPFAVTWISYTLTRKGFVPEELQYQNKKRHS